MKTFDENLNTIIKNQKILANAIEWIIWKEHWQLNMARESYDMMDDLRSINEKPKLNRRR